MNFLAAGIRALARHKYKLNGSRKTKYAALTIVLLSLITVISVYHDQSYEYTTNSISKLNQQINYFNAKIDSWRPTEANIESQALQQSTHNFEPTDHERQRAVIMMVAKNNELFNILETLRTVEERFNKEYQYDWVLITDIPYSEQFKVSVKAMVSSEVIFHVVSRSIDALPANLDRAKMRASKKQLRKQGINVPNSQRLRNVQRLWTQEIFTIDALEKYDYYMKVEPGVQLLCDLNFDIFDFMKKNSKIYGFAFAARTDKNGLPTFWEDVLSYIEENPSSIHPNHFLDFMSDDNGDSFNGCQFRANFEIGDLNFFRGELYQRFAEKFLEYNGIYYETWEDSTIRTLAVSLLLDKSQLQFFHNLGYNDFARVNHKACPFDMGIRLKNKCICDPMEDINWNGDSCIERFLGLNKIEIPSDVHDRRLFEAEERERSKKVQETEAAEHEEQRKAKEAEELIEKENNLVKEPGQKPDQGDTKE